MDEDNVELCDPVDKYSLTSSCGTKKSSNSVNDVQNTLTNQIFLNFTKRAEDMSSKSIKCKAFWDFIDTSPELKRIKTVKPKGESSYDSHTL